MLVLASKLIVRSMHVNFRLVKMSHDGILRWYGPRSDKDAKLWEKMINRGCKFKVKESTEVCSNHFEVYKLSTLLSYRS